MAASKIASERLKHFFSFQLKQEYGYAVNPLDPQFAEKIAAKEKEYSKVAKEEKKKMKAGKFKPAHDVIQ